jgi:hypothetical protein
MALGSGMRESESSMVGGTSGRTIAVSKFEEDLHRAAQQRSEAAATTEHLLQRFRQANAPARDEAARRLIGVAEDVRNFLVRRGVAPQQIMAGRVGFRGLHLEAVCSGWSLDPYFVTSAGRFVSFTADNRIHADPLKHRVKPGQRYLGRYGKTEPVKEFVNGVADAMFIPGGQPAPFFFSSLDAFNRYYYGDLYQPGRELPCPHVALLFTKASTELYLTRLDTYDRCVNVARFDQQIADSALKLVETHGSGQSR